MELSNKIGEMEYDGLISGLNPAVQVDGGMIVKLEEAVTYKRGTVLGFKEGSPDKLYIMDSSSEITPSCILCDDTEVGTEDDVTVPVYTAGCFNPDKITTKESYELSAGDLDNLRMRGIVFKAAAPAM